MNNEPVAIRYDFDGYGYQYIDSGSGSDWLTRVDGELLYTQPVKELSDDEVLEYVDAFSQQEGSVYVFQEENILEMIRSILESK
jgi:hypothetical protein